HDLARDYLYILLPSTPLLGLGICFASLLRAVGDARRSMYVTLAGGVAAAVLDPIFIFGLDLDLTGAAIASVISRVAMVAVGWHGASAVHNLLGPVELRRFGEDARALSAIAVPAVLTNIATPIASTYVTVAMARFGDSAVAGQAIVDRIVPVAFGAIFALSGSVAPIVGQNFGAGRLDRVRRTLSDSLAVVTIYVLVMWGVLVLLQDVFVWLFAAQGLAAELVRLFCNWLAAGFLFVGALFVANAAFNNLGFPLLSTAFNWGRATLGTIPFAAAGAYAAGAKGVVIGYALGSVVFGIAAVITAFWVVSRLQTAPADRPPALWRFTPPSADTGRSAAAGLAAAPPTED
ncbi:MAG: MATE family efflux transporter, partial [Pseudomonadota bacterium]|nr:MATE family efflux transporter [Pseudomonadota bacterium]